MIRIYLDFPDRSSLEEFFPKLQEALEADDAVLYLARPDEGRVSETYIVRRDGVRPDNEKLEF